MKIKKVTEEAIVLCKCELCKGTGKISLAFYEDIQKGCRR